MSYGVLYSDATTLIILEGERSGAKLLTTNPLFDAKKFALFKAILIKAGVSPLDNNYGNYNNTICDPK